MSTPAVIISRAACRVLAAVIVATTFSALGIFLAEVRADEVAKFEVASIKETLTTRGRAIAFLPGGTFRATAVSLRDLIKRAWSLQDDQIAGGPDWMAKDLFDINAKAPSSGAEVTQPQWLAMVKTLLADRFGLRAHEETRELPVYALLRKKPNGELGARIHSSNTDCAAFRQAVAEAQSQGGLAPPPAKRCGFGVRMSGESATLDIGAATMPQLATYLTPFAGRMVIDRTGIEGRFDVELEVSTAAVRQLAGSAPPSAGGVFEGANLFTSVQEQLGLKLEPAKAPISVLVVDAATRPTPN